MTGQIQTLDYLVKKHGINLGDEPPYMMGSKRIDYFPKLFHDLECKLGVEIGVEEGVFSSQLLGANPDLKMCAIDPWVSYGYYTTTKYNQAFMEEKYRRAVKRLAPYNCEIIREFSKDAALRFDDNSLDFVYIDGNHDLENASLDIATWTPKVRPGGIISGDDYVNSKNRARCRVKDAVDQWTLEKNIDVWFVVVGSVTPSWFWVKGENE